MFSSFTRQNPPHQNYTSSGPTRNDPEAGQQDGSRPLPLRTKGHLRKGIKNLENDFKHMAKNQDRRLTENLFWYQEFGPRSSNPYWYKYSRGDTFATSLVKLRSTLKHSSGSSASHLQICIINTSPVLEETLPWLSRRVFSSFGRLNSLLAFPRLAVGIEIEHAWGGLTDCTYRGIGQAEELLKVEQLSLPEFRRQFLSHTFSNCRCKSFRVAQISNYISREYLRNGELGSNQSKRRDLDGRTSVATRFSIELPSKGRQEASSLAKAQLAQCCRIFDRATASFSFTWQRSAPRYSGSFNAFLWERHSMAPSCSFAEVFYQDDRALPGPRRVLVTASNNTHSSHSLRTTQILDDLKLLLKTRKSDDSGVWPFMVLLQSNPHSDGYNLLPLFIIFEEIIRDTAIFLQQASDEITKLSFAGRSGASTSKVQYLCHVDDCRKSALLGVTHAYSILRDLISLVKKRRRPEQDTSPSIVAGFLKETRADMEFLIEQLEDHLTDRIRAESIQMKEHRMLLQCRQVSILTYMAFVWIPLSILIGIFGMNINSPNSIFQSTGPSTFIQSPQILSSSNAFANIVRQVTVTQTSTLPQSIPTLTPGIPQLDTYTEGLTNGTKPISSALSSTEPYTFPFFIFFILLPLLPAVSLFIPLTGPSLLRTILQNTHRLRKSLLFKPLLFITYYLAIFWLLPLTTIKYSNLRIPSLTRDLRVGSNPISLPSFIVSLAVTTLIFLFKISSSIRRRAGGSKILLWLIFGIVIIVSYSIDFFSDWLSGVRESVATGLSLEAIAPVLYLVGVWGGSLVRRYVLERERVPKMRDLSMRGKGLQEEVEMSRI